MNYPDIIVGAVKAVAPLDWPASQKHEHAVMIAKSELAVRGIRFDYTTLHQDIADAEGVAITPEFLPGLCSLSK
jgi:hypothetical protein